MYAKWAAKVTGVALDKITADLKAGESIKFCSNGKPSRFNK